MVNEKGKTGKQITHTTLLFLNIKTMKHKPRAPRVTATGERGACGAPPPPKTANCNPKSNKIIQQSNLVTAWE